MHGIYFKGSLDTVLEGEGVTGVGSSALSVRLGPSSALSTYVAHAPCVPLTHSGGRRGPPRPPARAKRRRPLAEAHHEASPRTAFPRGHAAHSAVTQRPSPRSLGAPPSPRPSALFPPPPRLFLPVGGQAATSATPAAAPSSCQPRGFCSTFEVFPPGLRPPSW